MQKSFWWWQPRSDRYISSLFPISTPPSLPLPPFSPSLISLMVSVDVKHHVYLHLMCSIIFYSSSGQYRPKKYFNSPSSFKLALLLATSKVLLLHLATYITKAFTTRSAYISQSITYAFFTHAGLCMYARRVYVLDSDMCEPSFKKMGPRPNQ